MGCRTLSMAMEEFSEFIDNRCLIDLPLTVANFTWARARDSMLKS